jgi:putative copper resistance protein D
VADPLILARSLHIAATVLASGTVAFMVLVAEPAARTGAVEMPALRRQLTLMVWGALAVGFLSGLGWLVLLASDILGTSIANACLHGGAWQVATETRFGLVWTARVALAILLGVLMLWPATRLLQLGAVAGLVALVGLIGHAGATPGLAGAIQLASDMLHLLSAGGWLGALPALAMLLAHARKSSAPRWDAAAVAAARRFSTIGIVCVAVLLASGAVNSWNLLAGPGDLVATGYGRLVLLKIGLFAAMVGIAAVNKYGLTPRLPSPAALRGLRRNSLAETGLGACVMVFVGVLGTMSPTAHIHSQTMEIPPDAAFVHIHTSEAMADVTIDPGRAGTVMARIHVSREDYTEFPAKDVTLALDPRGKGQSSVERAGKRMADGTWQAESIVIPQRGIWTVRVIITPAMGKAFVLDAPIVIEP